MKIFKVIITSVALTAMVSCSDDFLETKPTNAVGEADSQTPKGVQALLDGLNNMMYEYTFSGIGYGAASLNVQLDLLGDDVINTVPATHIPTYRYTSTKNITDDYGLNYRAWDYYYTMIEHANILINAATNSTELTESQRNAFLGEAYAYRAWAYHNLVQLFGKRYVPGTANSQLGVLLRLENNMTDELPRVTVGEVYAQIDSDMSKALRFLEVAPDKGVKNTIRYSTACGIASRIALTKQDWANAEKYADLAIRKSGAKLQSGTALLDGFNNYSATEWMWGYTQGSDQNYYYGHFNSYYSYNFSGYNRSFRYAVNRNIYDEMGANDVRRKWWVCLDRGDAIPADAAALYFLGGTTRPSWETTGQQIKFAVKDTKDSRGDMMIMRLAEMYYNKAEAQARQGKDAQAQTTLNTIMVTRDKDYNTSATGTALVDEIMRNKRIDLWLEGHRFFDMKRLGVIPDRLNSKNIQVYLTGALKNTAITRNSGTAVVDMPDSVDSKAWEFAIPYAETKANKLIVQNPL